MGASMSQIMDLDINKLKTKDIAGIMKSIGKLIMIPILFNNLKNKSKNANKDIEQAMGVKTNTFLKCQIKYLPSMVTDAKNRKNRRFTYFIFNLKI